MFFACHSDQALRLLADATALDERAVLGAIRYQRNDVLLHTDTRVLPKRKLAWAAWNYHLIDRSTDRVAVTYHMNILQRLETPHAAAGHAQHDGSHRSGARDPRD